MKARSVEELSRRRRHRELARLVRAHAVMMTNLQHSGHVGSSLSMADIIAVLYESVLRVDPARPRWEERDRFILSKGHAAAGVYAALAEKGFFPKEWLRTYYGDDGKLCGHISHHVPGVEFSTGSLGHGLPVAAGMALAARQAGRQHRVFVLMSDGDCDEGSTWEAMLFSAQHRLDNLVAIVDYNRVQALGMAAEVIELEPFAEKAHCFGWGVREIDGHDFSEIEEGLRELPFEPGRPSFCIARTVKGKGIRAFENTVASHYQCVPDDGLAAAYRELGVSHENGIQ